MGNETRQNIGWTVAVTLLGILGSVIGIGVYDLRSDIQMMQQEVREFGVAIAKQMTASDGMSMWKDISEIKQQIKTLPPDYWRNKIETNARDIVHIRTLLGVHPPAVTSPPANSPTPRPPRP